MDYTVVTKSKKCWSSKRAWDWYNKHPLIVGVNYVPSYAVNTTEFFQKESYNEEIIRKELDYAVDANYNTIRVFLPYILFEQEHDDFIKNLDNLINICKEKKLYFVPVLFDDCAFSNLEPYMGKQNAPTPFTHNSGWTPSPGKVYSDDVAKYPLLKKYVMEIVSRYKDNETVLMWDLYNEPGNSARCSKSYYLVEKAFEWARLINPSQPLTVAPWVCVHNGPSSDQIMMELRELELSDVITFHYYANKENTLRFINEIKQIGYPIICTEWMARVFFDSTIESVFPIFEEENIGSIHWGLVNGKTQTHYPWGYDKQEEPEVWFHDVFHKDGTPYNLKEYSIIKNRRK